MAAFIGAVALSPASPAIGLTAAPVRGAPLHTERLPARRSAWTPGAVVLDAARRSRRGWSVARRRAVWGPVATHASPAAAVCDGEGGEDRDAAASRRTHPVPTDVAAADEAAAAAAAAAAVFPHVAVVAGASAAGGGLTLLTLALPVGLVAAAATPGMYLDVHLGSGRCLRSVIASKGSGVAAGGGGATPTSEAGYVQLLLPAVEVGALQPPGRVVAVSEPGGRGVALRTTDADTPVEVSLGATPGQDEDMHMDAANAAVLVFVDGAHGLAIARSVAAWDGLPAATALRVYVACGEDGGVAEAAAGVLPPTTAAGGAVSAVSVSGERMARRLTAEASMGRGNSVFGAPGSVAAVVALADAEGADEVVAALDAHVDDVDQVVVFASMGDDGGLFEVEPLVTAAADALVAATEVAAAVAKAAALAAETEAAAETGEEFIGGDDERSSPAWAAAAAAASATAAAAFWTSAPSSPADGVGVVPPYLDDDVGWQSDFEEAVWRQWSRVREEMAAEYARRYAQRPAAGAAASDAGNRGAAAPAWEAWFAANAAAWEAAAWDADVWSAYNESWTTDPTPDAGGSDAADARRWAAYGSRRKGSGGRTYNSYGQSGWGATGAGGSYTGGWSGGRSTSSSYGSSSYSSSSSSSSSWASSGGSSMNDYFVLLGVTATSTAKEVKVAYRTAAKRWHPDRNRGDEAAATAMMKKIVVAYSAICERNGGRR